MKRHISKMKALAAPDAYPKLFLEGRISYRKSWALEPPQPSKQFRQKDRKWELEYDLENNFAHMGARYVDDDWGLMKPPKPKPKQLSPEVERLLQLMHAKSKDGATPTAL